MAILIKADGTETEVKPKDKETGFTLEELYELLDAETVQMVVLADGRSMWMDEEFKLKEAALKDLNQKATHLLERAGGIPGDYILGSVLIEKGEVK